MVTGKNRIISVIVVIATLLTTQPQPTSAASQTAPTLPLALPGIAQKPNDTNIEVDSVSIADDILSRAPAASQAIVVDEANPEWATVYGTEAGAMNFAPRATQFPSAVEGATPPLSGTWRTITPQVSANGITAIAYAADGRLFAGLGSAGLRVFAPDANGIYVWNTIPAAPTNVSALTIFNGDLWVGTPSSGAKVYDLSTNAWVFTYTTANSGLVGNAINRFTPVDNPKGTDYLWISTNSGVARYTPGRPPIWYTRTVSNGLPSNTVFDTAVSIGTSVTTTYFATESALASWNGASFTAIYGSASCAFDYVKRTIFDRQGRLWVTPYVIIPALASAEAAPAAPAAGVHNPIGLCRYASSVWTKYDSVTPGLPSSFITDLSEDFAGRIWMSMQSNGGGAVYDNGTWAFYTQPTRPITNNVSRVLAAGEAVWFGYTSASTFATYSPNWIRTPASTLGQQPGPLALSPTRTWAGIGTKLGYQFALSTTWATVILPGNSSVISSLHAVSDTLVWIGTAGNGIYKFDNGVLSQEHSTGNGLPSNSVHSLLRDHLGRLWAGTNSGLALYTEANYWLRFTTADSPILSNTVNTIVEDSANRLWIGTAAGISILDLNSMQWSAFTTGNGLPSNAVRSIATSAAGETWVGTDNRLAMHSAISNTWTIYSTTNGLPSNAVLQVIVDNLGRVWVATNGGIVMREITTWKPIHVPGTMIESNRVVGLAGDANRTWIAATGSPTASSSIAVRGVLTSPIGGLVPSITSFSPISATPNTKIIVKGVNFDDRGPEFNVLLFSGANGFPVIPAEILSVTKTSMAVKVPWSVSSGKLQVKANGLSSPLSVADFKLKPQITKLSATCLSVGSELKITGIGFLDSSAAAYIKIGTGPERIADATDPTELRTYIRPDDSGGTVRVRLLNNNSALSQESLGITEISLLNAYSQQAIEGLDMIWGKRTLVQLHLRSIGCGNAQITQANLDWKFTNGTRMSGGFVQFPTPVDIPAFPGPVSMNTALSIIATLDLNDLVGKFGQPANASSLPYFNGISVTLRNNLVNVMTIHIPKEQFKYIDTSGRLRRLTTMMVSGDTADEQDADFTQKILVSMAAAARVYPQQDVRYSTGKYYWLYDTTMWYSSPYKIKIASKDGNQDEYREKVNDWLKPTGNNRGIMLVDASNVTTDSALGLGSPAWHTVVAVNRGGLAGRLMIHEVLHSYGFVNKSATNYQYSSEPGEDNHSKYDEGQWSDDFATCDDDKTFSAALDDQLGEQRRVVRISSSGAVDMIVDACSTTAGNNLTDTAKSIISYAPARRNTNVVMEPVDYTNSIVQLCIVYDEDTKEIYNACPSYFDSNALSASRTPELHATDLATRTFALSGRIGPDGVVTPSLSFVSDISDTVTPQQPAGTYHLIVRGEGNAVLHDQKFVIEGEGMAPHDRVGILSPAHSEDISSTHVSLFNLRVPFPTGAITAEIQHDANVLWSANVSANAPVVNLLTPNGGVYPSTAPMTVTWSASDLDADVLQFQIDYSVDGGNTWQMVEPNTSGNSFTFIPGFLTASNVARLRVRASDGFNTSSATSNPFTLSPHPPAAIILAPQGDEEYTEGEIIVLDGTSMTSKGSGEGNFVWKRGVSVLGVTRTITTALSGIGLFTFTLQVSDSGMTATQIVSLTVVNDYDKDKLPNAWEQQYLLNPLSAADATADSDGDNLNNLDEHKYGTNPKLADTDGDGFNDGVELDAGTDPLDPNSKPSAQPILNVGSTSMGFAINDYSPLPGPHHTWVTNGGGGTLNFQVSDDAPWLFVTPGTGTAAQTITVTYNHAGLALGTYEGHVVVSSTGVTGSPHTITVTLHVEHAILPVLYMPIVMK